MSADPFSDLAALPTPALLVERRVLESNIEWMAARVRTLGVALRPHVKTHKCVEVATLQAARGIAGLTVSTLAEARAFAAAGFDDLTWALPLEPAKIGPALEMARGIRLRLLLDDESTAVALEKAARALDVPVHVWLKIDCGYHRAGLAPDSEAAWSLARRLATSSVLRFDGPLTHAGHAYAARDDRERLRLARDERDAVLGFARRLRRDGLNVPEVSLGSTPTLTIIDDLGGVTEVRPGNYVYYDLTQAGLGSCRRSAIAVSVLATVISHAPGGGRAVVDAGALALSKDAGAATGSGPPTMGAVCPLPGKLHPDPTLRLESLSQEHGIIRPAAGESLDGRLPVGSRVRILPNHSCLTSACHDVIWVVDRGRVTGSWKVHRER